MRTVHTTGLSVAVLLVAGVHAQSGPDAAALIADVAAAARSAKSWVVEGERTYTVSGARPTWFRIWYIPVVPSTKGRAEIGERTEYEARVCDGSMQWTWYPFGKSYTQLSSGRVDPCVFPLNEWATLDTALKSPRITGTDRVTINGADTECTIVRGEYEPNGPVGQARALCVNTSRKAILWYETDVLSGTLHMISRVTLAKSQRDVDIEAERFVFTPPQGSTPIVSSGVYRVGGSVTAPAVMSKVEPEYTKEAKAAGVEGKVALYLEVTPEGTASNIKIVRPLDPGLDQRAVEAVKQWRFRPGMKDGMPATVAATIEVNFRLNHKKQP